MALTLIRRPLGALPSEVTALVGRQTELAQLASLLGVARLVTVTGPGGVGKTRVALRVAANLAGSFTDGACLVELSVLTDPELLPHTIATCLGLPERDTRSQLDALLDYLRERQMLLILDTCEHLVDACAMLSDVLLRETVGVTVLATSRQPLDVPGEHLCAIPPLPVRSFGSADSDAVDLFAQRAAAVVPGFSLSDANRDDAIRLCERLDGMPLAIELAAVRLRAVPLHQLAGRLEEHFRILTGGMRSALPRHQTLHATIEWSYDPCSPAEQMLWRRLSVFAGTFDLVGVEAVCADQSLPREEILPTLIGLVDKSVVLRVEDGLAYRMLDTIREFGAERLAEMGEEAVLRDRHVRHYLEKAIYFGENLIADDQMPRFHELRREHSNIRAALEYALATPGGDQAAAGIATYLYGYWELSGLHREGKHWLDRVLDRFPAPCSERVWALGIRGLLGAFQGQTAQAIADLEATIPIAVELKKQDAIARAYVTLCIALAFAGEHDRAIEAGNRAERELREVGDIAGLLFLDSGMGYLYLMRGDAKRAIERCKLGLTRLAEYSAERWLHSWLYLVTALALLSQEDYDQALAALSRALEMKYELGDIVGMAQCLEGTAWLAARQGRPERAAWMMGAAAPRWEQSGARLYGDPVLEAFYTEAADRVRAELGKDRFDELFRQGETHPLEQIIAVAISDDDVPSPGSGDDAGATPIVLGSLTRREIEIAGLVADGLSNREIAERLVISKRTVDAHVEHIFAKLGVSSRVQVATWMRTGASSTSVQSSLPLPPSLPVPPPWCSGFRRLAPGWPASGRVAPGLPRLERRTSAAARRCARSVHRAPSASAMRGASPPSVIKPRLGAGQITQSAGSSFAARLSLAWASMLPPDHRGVVPQIVVQFASQDIGQLTYVGRPCWRCRVPHDRVPEFWWPRRSAFVPDNPTVPRLPPGPVETAVDKCRYVGRVLRLPRTVAGERWDLGSLGVSWRRLDSPSRTR